MTQRYNVYCDESCHQEHDHHGVMVLGAVWCQLEKTREIAERIREIKAKHGMSPTFEAKWSKVSPAGVGLYRDLIDYFFDDDDLHFRAIVVPNKGLLRHDHFGQSHDDWYYKMYFDLLKVILKPDADYRIYLDIKDTRSQEKVRKLHEVLANSVYDFSRTIVQRVQTVRSHEIEILQVADLLIGAVGYVNRGLGENAGKVALAERVQKRSGYSLKLSTLLQEPKVNIFVWRAAEALR